MGIPLGTTYNEVKEMLETRYGEYHVFEDVGNLHLYNILVGGFSFYTVDFNFQRLGYKMVLNEIVMQQLFNTNEFSKAKAMRESIAEVLREKYNIQDIIGKDGIKFYAFGRNPKDKEKNLGFLFITKGKGNDGKTRYYLMLNYGPINYADRSADF